MAKGEDHCKDVTLKSTTLKSELHVFVSSDKKNMYCFFLAFDESGSMQG